MKKILLISTLFVSVCFADDSFAKHEAKMKQIQERTMTQENQGSGEQKRNRYRYKNGGNQSEIGRAHV